MQHREYESRYVVFLDICVVVNLSLSLNIVARVIMEMRNVSILLSVL